MLRRLAVLLASFASVLAGPAIARAAPPGRAQALFDQGIADLEAGRFERACPAIEASQRLEPMPGTLFALAECEAQRGRIATAVRYYTQYAALYRTFTAQKKAEQKSRAAVSEEQIRKLELLAPRLTLALPASANEAVVVKRNGEVVTELSFGVPLPVDPGEHVVTTQVAAGPLVEHRISLAPGESKTLVLTLEGELGPEPLLPPTVIARASAVPSPQAAPVDLRPRQVGIWTSGVVGIVGIAIGAVAGVLAIEQRGVMSRHCKPVDGNTDSCTQAAMEAHQRILSFGTASTFGFAAGAIGLGINVALILSTPVAPARAPATGPAKTAATAPLLRLTVSGSF